MASRTNSQTSQDQDVDIDEELKIAAEARKELGPGFDDLLVQSFLEKVDKAIDARVETKAAEMLKSQKKSNRSSTTRLAITMCLAIPLVALAGIFGSWIGIVAVTGTILLLNLPWRR